MLMGINRFMVFILILFAFISRDVFAVELVKRPLRFVTPSGNEIETYCVAPLYVKTYGIGLGAELSGRKTHPERYLKWPAIIKEGDEFYRKIRRTRERGFAIFTFVVGYGEAITPTAYIILKKGYTPLFWNSYIDVTKVVDVPMEKGDSESTLEALIAKNPEQKQLREIFHLKDSVVIVNEYTDADRELLRKCYYGSNP